LKHCYLTLRTLTKKLMDNDNTKTYTADEVSALMSNIANVAVAAWLDPGRYCERDHTHEEGLGDWCSRAKAIAVRQYIENSIIKTKGSK